jgi:hypothetical protein
MHEAAGSRDEDEWDLEMWLQGRLALPPERARHLLARRVRAGAGTGERGAYVAAVKALAAGEANWPEMGLRLVPVCP